MIDVLLGLTVALGICVSLIAILYKHLEAKIMTRIMEYYRGMEDRIYSEIARLRDRLDEQNKRIMVMNRGLKFSLETQNKVLNILLSNIGRFRGIEKESSIDDSGNVKMEKRGAVFKEFYPVNLEKLNDTERSVLLFLSEAERKVSVREIQLHTGRSREHIARLMKKMYEDGYVEREGRGNSYVYWVRGEVRDIIRRDARTS
ncbi:MAG: helix-turn-helix domain-containing protein [Nitrososphaerota archaeon]|nr:MarR family transcriptional regulator [Candidatus Bathyarchaeota archaeon]MDW8061225.1 helix-turn-helix domain-containing protein [Nitrososphaerota archaeon]